MPNPAPTYCCPICKQEYPTQKEAEDCVKNFGVPKVPKFKPKDKVQIKQEWENGVVTLTTTVYRRIYAKPQMQSAAPHTLIYILILDVTKPWVFTTARESELTPA